MYFFIQKIKNFLNQDALFTAMVLILSTLILSLTGVLARFDHVFYDTSQFLSFKKAPQDVVIVAIDERSLDTIGKWPWRRNVHVQVLQRILADQPKVIGVDIFFSEPDKNYPQDDRALADVLARAKNIVLPVVVDAPYLGARLADDHTMPSLPVAAEGRVNVPLDADGIARGIYLWEGISRHVLPAQAFPHFSYVVLQVAGLLPKNITQKNLWIQPKNTDVEQALSASVVVREQEKKIRFYGPPGHFQQVSYAHVLSNQVPTGFFNNKIVLVGATAIGMGDVLATPVSGFSKPMPGVEFHANSIETIRHQQLISVAPSWLTACFCIFLAVIPLSWLPRFRPLKSLLLIILYLAAVILLTMLLPFLTKLWIPTSPAMLMILLAYPIWSWRRLERAQTFLNHELQLLGDDLKQFGMVSADGGLEKNDIKQDVLQHRIVQVKRAAELLRTLQKNRNDTLAFISHDIRAPLATALMMLNAEDAMDEKNKIVQTLDRAKQMADSFLQLSKAEAITPVQFRELELNGLLQETVDNLYPTSRVKNIRIHLIHQENALWIRGEFGLLQRAFENILSNAIKYSPENTHVTVQITQKNQTVYVAFTDQGVGIAVDKVATLFQKFTRLENTARVAEGIGLGLYFVSLIIHKHFGTVSVKSEVGKFTTFTVSLPLIEA